MLIGIMHKRCFKWKICCIHINTNLTKHTNCILYITLFAGFLPYHSNQYILLFLYCIYGHLSNTHTHSPHITMLVSSWAEGCETALDMHRACKMVNRGHMLICQSESRIQMRNMCTFPGMRKWNDLEKED